jgi:hypothetical protein
MTALQPFDPYTDADRFLDLYWAGNEDKITNHHFDPDDEKVPVCPGDRFLRAFAVRATKPLQTHFPRPNLVVQARGEELRLWFIPTIDTEESSKAANLRLMVSQSFAHNYGGAPIKTFPNPFFGWASVQFQEEIVTLTTMRNAISKVGAWKGTTLHAELLSRGGCSTSPAKAAAAKENAKKATLAKLAKRAEQDAQMLAALNKGMTVEAMAAKLGKTQEFVSICLARAERATLNIKK